MKINFWFGLALLFVHINALVVTEPCCHVFEHRGAMFGPQLPLSSTVMVDYLPPKRHISSVEGPIKLTSKEHWSLCSPETVARSDYHFVESIALIPRGGCSFAEKVYSSQLLGAKAAIIFQAQDAHESVLSDTSNDDVIVMAEDSKYGELVEIPSAFISYNSWQHIKTLLLETNTKEEVVSTYYSAPSLRSLLHSDEDLSNKPIVQDELNYEQEYTLRMNSNSIRQNLSVEKDVSDLRELLSEKQIYIVLNETGALPSSGTDAMPMMWDSMIFLMKIFVIIWSIMGFAYLSNWIKARYNRYRRQNVIRSLPQKKYAALRLMSNQKSMRLENSSDDLEASQTQSVTLEEFDPLLRQKSDLKLRNSPQKKKKNTPKPEPKYIECDNCVICLCEFEADDLVTVLPCGHIFHKECIEPWLVNKSSLCPICKQSIFKNGESRSLNEINESEEERESTWGENDDDRNGSALTSIIMFIIILVTLTFLVSDESND